jgi:tetratricopeptide (TPR) repeat protein
MRGLPIIILLIALLSFRGFGSDISDSLVQSGNKAYNEANYLDAVDDYLAVIDMGFASPGLYYNLGNSYFKLNNIPAAILYYEKALKLAPKDEDINFNLSLANSRIIDKIEPVPEFFLKKWWQQITRLMPPDTWGIVGIIIFVALLIALAIFFTSRSVPIRKITFWSGTLLLILALICFYIGYQGIQAVELQQHGIVFTPTVTVKSSPTENSVDLFVIHEGTKVELLDKLDSWVEIKIANGSVGWVRDYDYQPI